MSYRRLLSLMFSLVALRVCALVTEASCINNGTYTNNSTYRANLRNLLSNLSSANVADNGLYTASVGESPDRVNAIVLCRGDTQLDSCRSCIQDASVSIVQECPNSRQAVHWEEHCTLRYSDTPINMGTMETFPFYILQNPYNSTRPYEFMSDLTSFLGNISTQASNGGSLRKLGYGSIATVGSQTIYALQQCMPDLSPEDCLSCLNTAAQRLPGCCYGIIGARIHQPSCNLQYEVREFYNETRLREIILTMPVPVPMAPPPSQAQPEQGNGNNNDNNTTRIIIIVVVSIVGGIIVLVVVLIGYLKWRMNNKRKEEIRIDGASVDDISIIESLHYDFPIIQVATDDFSDANKLGQGGFGAVYKGKLPNGKGIAVKRLSRGSRQGDLEFKNEVILLANLQHRNLVRLFGFSYQGQEKLLIYELVQNASLDQFLFDPTRCSQLDWNTRYKIIGGIARGILYLHEDSRVRIIHRDLKASNVLLDGDMNPKIADFGLARLFIPDETQDATSRIVGTYGYMAPEYALRGQFSIKSDVFSFGVIILEIVSGLKNNYPQNGETEEGLISNIQAWGSWQNGTVANLVDHVLRVGSSVPRDILKCIHIGLLCVQESAAQRPTMATIVTMLNSYSTTLPAPSPPAFYVPGGNNIEFTTPSTNGGDGSRGLISQNEMSISELDAR